MPKPRRIAFPFVGDTLGGSHLSAITLIQQLPGQGFDPRIVLHTEGALSRYLDQIGLPYAMLANASVAGRQPNAFRQLSALAKAIVPIVTWLRGEGIDLVHANDARMIVTWALPALWCRLPLVAHQRTVAYASRVLSLGWAIAARIVAISRFSAATLPAWAQAKTSVVYNAVAIETVDGDRDYYRQKLLMRAGLDDARIVGVFGNISAVKQPMLFSRTLSLLAESTPVVGVWFGEDREGWIAKMKADAGKAVLLFPGFHAPVTGWISACDAVLATSSKDAFGRTLVEAMSLGIPVVATAAGGHSEIATDGKDAVLVSSGNAADMAEGMAEGLRRVLRNSEFSANLIAQGKRRAMDFSAVSHAKRMGQLYRELLSVDRMVVISDLGSGGAQRIACDLAAHWCHAGLSVAVVTLAAAEDRYRLDSAIRRISLDLSMQSGTAWQGVIANMRRIFVLRRVFRQLNPVVVVSFVGTTNILAVMAGFGLSSRVIISERNNPERQSLGRVWSTLRQLLYRFADCVTVNSRQARDTLAAYVPHHKLQVIENQLSEQCLIAKDEVQNSNELLILAVGRLHHQKAYDVLLTAFAVTRAAQTGWRLVILGEGPLHAALQQQAESLHIGDRIELRGYEPDPTAWYRRAGIFVMPSRYEGMPNALLEAAAFGLPAVVSDTCGGAVDLIENGISGLIVPAEAITSLAHAIDSLAFDRDFARRLGGEARRRVMAKHDPAAIYAVWEKVVAT